MKGCKISILMPAYNDEKHIAEAIESILDQSISDFELLILNDASVDDTEKVILGFSDKRIRYIKNEKNLGLSENLNKGMKLANGQYFARMDGDDICLPGRLEKQLRVLEENPDIDICGGSYEFFGSREDIVIQPQNHDDIKAGLLFGCNVTLTLSRRRVFENHKLLYSTDYFPAEDYKMWADCSKITTLHNIPEVLFKYRMHESQISTENQVWQKDQSNRVRIEVLDHLFHGFTEKEKEYHIKTFIPGKIDTRKDFENFDAWVEKLLDKNREINNFDQKALSQKLKTYSRHIRQRWIRNRYFARKYSLKGFWKYFRSGMIAEVSCQYSMKLFIKSILFRK